MARFGKGLPLPAALAIDAELVAVRDGSRLWGDRFKRRLADVQFVQAEARVFEGHGDHCMVAIAVNFVIQR